LVGLLVGATALSLLGPPREVEARRGRTARVTQQRRQAQALVKQGVRKLREGDYVVALDLFSRAYALYPSPKIQFNLGQTYTELGRYLDGLRAYETFLVRLPPRTSGAVQRLTRDRIAELMRRIAVLTLECAEPGAAVTVDGQAQGHTPLSAPLRLMPGPHSVVVRKEGYLPVVWNLQLEAGQRLTRRVRLERPRPKVVQVVWKTVRKPRKGLPLLWAGVAVTAAAALTAAITGGLALREQDFAKDVDKPWSERVAAADRGRALQRATDGLLIATGVLAAGALAWFLVVVRPSGGTERVRISAATRVTLTPALGPRGAAARLSVSF
jgi:hypothetical protein